MGRSWKMDETYIKVNGKWVYLYRAVDSDGATIDFMLSETRDRPAVLSFFKRAIGSTLVHGCPGYAIVGVDFHGYEPMPHKHNAGKRHHIPKAKFTITNWPEYENGLKQRGSLTLWLTPEVIALWKASARTTPGGQARYSDLAIQTCLMLRTAFRIPLRQAEGLMASVISLMNLGSVWISEINVRLACFLNWLTYSSRVNSSARWRFQGI